MSIRAGSKGEVGSATAESVSAAPDPVAEPEPDPPPKVAAISSWSTNAAAARALPDAWFVATAGPVPSGVPVMVCDWDASSKKSELVPGRVKSVVLEPGVRQFVSIQILILGWYRNRMRALAVPGSRPVSAMLRCSRARQFQILLLGIAPGRVSTGRKRVRQSAGFDATLDAGFGRQRAHYRDTDRGSWRLHKT